LAGLVSPLSFLLLPPVKIALYNQTNTAAFVRVTDLFYGRVLAAPIVLGNGSLVIEVPDFEPTTNPNPSTGFLEQGTYNYKVEFRYSASAAWREAGNSDFSTGQAGARFLFVSFQNTAADPVFVSTRGVLTSSASYQSEARPAQLTWDDQIAFYMQGFIFAAGIAAIIVAVRIFRKASNPSPEL